VYLPGNKKRKLSSLIKINKNQSISEKIVDLLHEGTHAQHDLQGCKCMNDEAKENENEQILAEYHAMQETLKIAHRWQDKQIMKAAIDVVQMALVCDSYSHSKAAKKIMKLKSWKKYKNFLDNKG